MPTHDSELDLVFRALSHPTRRTVVQRLTHGPAGVSELAQPFDMALPSFMQHMGVLEAGGIVVSRKEGRVRTYRLTPDALENAETWLGKQRMMWRKRLDQLDDYLVQLDDRRDP